MTTTAETLRFLETTLPAERARLVRLCAKIAGDYGAAEDLAQETLYEAWRNGHKLRDPDGLQPWLSAIARNVCLRWRSSRDQITLPFNMPSPDDWADDEINLELELERQDLVDLLDRALALLPPETRAIFVSRYVDELPQAEIAEAFRLSDGAVKMRLHRGKLALRQVLAIDLADDVNAYSLLDPTSAGWRETRIWCPFCGGCHLDAHIDPQDGDFSLRCPSCFPRFGLYEMRAPGRWRLFDGLRACKAIFRRVAGATNDYYRGGLVAGTTTCLNCGHPAVIEAHLPPNVLPRTREALGVQARCPACGESTYTSLSGLVLAHPIAQRFWRAHPRIRTLPECEVEVDGQAALRTTFESMIDSAKLTVLSDRESFRVLRIDRRDGTGG